MANKRTRAKQQKVKEQKATEQQIALNVSTKTKTLTKVTPVNNKVTPHEAFSQPNSLIDKLINQKQTGFKQSTGSVVYDRLLRKYSTLLTDNTNKAIVKKIAKKELSKDELESEVYKLRSKIVSSKKIPLKTRVEFMTKAEAKTSYENAILFSKKDTQKEKLINEARDLNIKINKRKSGIVEKTKLQNLRASEGVKKWAKQQQKFFASIGIKVTMSNIITKQFMREFQNTNEFNELAKSLNGNNINEVFKAEDELARLKNRLQKTGVAYEIAGDGDVNLATLGFDYRTIKKIREMADTVTDLDIESAIDYVNSEKSKYEMRRDQFSEREAENRSNYFNKTVEVDPTKEFDAGEFLKNIIDNAEDIAGKRGAIHAAVNQKIYGQISQDQMMRSKISNVLINFSDDQIKALYEELIAGRFAAVTHYFGSSGDGVHNEAQAEDLEVLEKISGESLINKDSGGSNESKYAFDPNVIIKGLSAKQVKVKRS